MNSSRGPKRKFNSQSPNLDSVLKSIHNRKESYQKKPQKANLNALNKNSLALPIN